MFPYQSESPQVMTKVWGLTAKLKAKYLFKIILRNLNSIRILTIASSTTIRYSHHHWCPIDPSSTNYNPGEWGGGVWDRNGTTVEQNRWSLTNPLGLLIRSSENQSANRAISYIFLEHFVTEF